MRPEQLDRLLIQGPAGDLAVKVESARGFVQPVTFVMCHPHPLFQGSMDNKVVTTMTKLFNGLGIKTIRFNYLGVGDSAGKYGRGVGETDDALAVIEWARAQDPNHEIWLGGFSFGGAVAYRAAMPAKVEQLLTLAPGVATLDLSDAVEPDMPWVVMHSQDDEVVPIQPVLAWLQQRQCAYDLIKWVGVSHFFHGQLVALRRKLEPIYRQRLPVSQENVG